MFINVLPLILKERNDVPKMFGGRRENKLSCNFKVTNDRNCKYAQYKLAIMCYRAITLTVFFLPSPYCIPDSDIFNYIIPLQDVDL